MTFAVPALLTLLATPKGVWSQALTEPDANCTAYLQDVIDCITAAEKYRCDPLPIPPQAYPPMVDPTKGYMIENPRKGAYGVSEGTYWMMIFVGDDAVEASPAVEKKNGGRGLLRSSLTTNRRNQEMPDSSFPVEHSEDGASSAGVKVLLVDFPPSVNITGALDEILFDLESMNPEDIGEIMMLYSHDHLDHIGGATIVHDHILETYNQETVEILAAQGTYDLIQARLAEGRWLLDKAPPATQGFEEQMNLTLSDEMVLELEVVSAHTEDRDVIAYLPRGNDDEVSILMAVDIAYAGWAPFYDVAIASDLLGYQRVLAKFLDDYDFEEGDYFNGGHLTKTGTRSDLELFKRFIDDAFVAAGTGLATSDGGPLLMEYDFFTPGSRAFANTWFVSDVSIDLAARTCLTQLLPEYGCLLAGLDVMGYSMCHALIIFYITET